MTDIGINAIAGSVYEYSRPERNPVAWVVAGLIAAFAIYGLAMGAQPVFWLCLAFFAVVNLWVIWGKTTHGLRIDDQTLTVSPARDPQVISLPLIARIHYVSDGPRQLVEVIRRDGRVHKMNPVHFPRPATLETLLAPQGITVSQS